MHLFNGSPGANSPAALSFYDFLRRLQTGHRKPGSKVTVFSQRELGSLIATGIRNGRVEVLSCGFLFLVDSVIFQAVSHSLVMTGTKSVCENSRGARGRVPHELLGLCATYNHW